MRTRNFYYLLTIFVIANVCAFDASSATVPDSVASGAWVNKYFVDFQNDWPSVGNEDSTNPKLITSVSGVPQNGTQPGYVERKGLNIGTGLKVENQALVVNVDDLNLPTSDGDAIEYTAENDTVIVNNTTHKIKGNYQAGDNISINGNVISANIPTFTDTNTINEDGHATSVSASGDKQQINVVHDEDRALWHDNSTNELYVAVDGSTIDYDGTGKLTYVGPTPGETKLYKAGVALNLTGTNTDTFDVQYDDTKGVGYDTSTKKLSVKVDGTTIDYGSNGELVAIGGGGDGDTKYTSGVATDVTDNGPVDVKYDDTQGINVNNSNQLYVPIDPNTMNYGSNGELVAKGDGDTKYTSGVATDVTDNGPVDVRYETNTLGITNPTDNKLYVKYDQTRAINADANGLYVKVDGNSVTINNNGELQANLTGSGEIQDTNTEYKCPIGWANVGGKCHLLLTNNSSKENNANVVMAAQETNTGGSFPNPFDTSNPNPYPYSE